jgi:hypothetical protein
MQCEEGKMKTYIANAILTTCIFLIANMASTHSARPAKAAK